MAKRTSELRKTIARLDSIIGEYKKINSTKNSRKDYEWETEIRLRTCFESIDPLIKEAVGAINVKEKCGAKSKLKLEQMLKLLIIKQICGKSNRNMSFMLMLFSTLTNISISYKTIERLFSNNLVKLAIINLHILTLRKRGVKIADATADGTGYTVFIGEHYATTASKLKEKAKDHRTHNKKIYYFFAIMDIKTRMYVGYGTSMRCEQDAFQEALKMTKQNGVELECLRIDRLFSAEAYCNQCQFYFSDMKYITIPKKNIAHFGLGLWGKMLRSFLDDTFKYLKVYFQRNQSESGFSEDKKRTGWRIFQKLDERIETTLGLIALWHNLSWVSAG